MSNKTDLQCSIHVFSLFGTEQMRLPRLTLDPEACAYHCIARTVEQKWFFDTPARRDQIVKIIEACSILKGARILNFVVMSNHIHLLVQMESDSSRTPLTETSLIKVAKVLYRKNYVFNLKQEFSRAKKADKLSGENDNWHTQRVLQRFEDRRGCLSDFMKEVKERIAYYIKKEHNRKGVLWDGRFKSPIVQNTLESLLSVSAYIDLNAIRAGIVSKPEDYRWCGYAAALGGNKMAQKGIAKLYTYRGGNNTIPSWNRVRAEYRQHLFEKGIELLEDPESGAKGRLGFSADEVEREIDRRGKLTQQEVLLYRVRYFTDGAVIGSASFVDQVFQTHRKKLVSPESQRNSGARQMRGADWGNLACLRDLQQNRIGHGV